LVKELDKNRSDRMPDRDLQGVLQREGMKVPKSTFYSAKRKEKALHNTAFHKNTAKLSYWVQQTKDANPDSICEIETLEVGSDKYFDKFILIPRQSVEMA
jgi:hypothetical protein